MRWLFLIPFAALVTNLFVSAFVFGRRRQSPVNGAFLGFLGTWAVWLTLELLLCSPIFAADRVLMLKLMVPFWTALGVVYLNFVYVLLGRRRDLPFLATLAASAAAIAFNLLTARVTLGYEVRWWGIADLRDPLLHTLACAPSLFGGMLGVALIARRYLVTREPRERRAFLVFLVGSALTLGSIGVMNVLLPNAFGLLAFARYGSSTAMFFLLSVYIAAVRFQFLGFTVDDVADELFEDTRDGVVLIDGDGGLLRANRAARAMLALGDRAPGGTAFAALLPAGIPALSAGGASCTLPAPEGERLISVSAPVALAGAPRPTSFLLLRDETEERNAERILRRARDELEREVRRRTEELKRAQRLEALGALASGIGHDFNNLLAAAMGFAAAALDELAPEHPVRDDLEEILLASRRGREVVKQLLALSDDGAAGERRSDVVRVAEEALKLMRGSLPERIAVERRFADDALLCRCDPTRLLQLFMNLLGNAVQAMEGAGGTLAVAIEGIDLPAGAAAEHPPLAAGRHVRATISDTGVGMDAKTLARIFEPFFTTKAARGGTGLGLVTALRIAREAQGVILVDSAPGRGSTFRVILPRLPAEPAERAVAAPLAVGGSERVLLLDDQEQVLRVGRRMLTALGYTVAAFTDQEAALAALAREPEAYDVLVTDLLMPGPSGIEVGLRARALAPRIRTILISGNLTLRERAAAAAAGFDLSLQKPLAKDELAAALRRLLDAGREAR